VATYDSNGEFPAFYTRRSGYRSACDVTSPYEAAGLLEQCQNTGSGVLLAVPIPEEMIKSNCNRPCLPRPILISPCDLKRPRLTRR